MARAPRVFRESLRRTTQKTPPQVWRAFPVRAAAACSHPCASLGARAGRGAGTPPRSPSPRAPAAKGRPWRARPRVTAGPAPFVCGRSAAAASLARRPGGPAPSWLASCICMSTLAFPASAPPRPLPCGCARRAAWRPPRGSGARALARENRACSGRAAAAAAAALLLLQPCQRARAWAHHEPWPCP